MTARLLPHDAVRRIQQRTADAFGVRLDDILMSDHRRKYVRPRQAAMYLACWLTPYSLTVLGRIFRRDRTTVGSGADQAIIHMAYEPDFSDRVNGLLCALSDEFGGAG